MEVGKWELRKVEEYTVLPAKLTNPSILGSFLRVLTNTITIYVIPKSL